MRGDHAEESCEIQADATLDQAAPASGTQYTLLATTKKARIIGVSVVVTWTVQPTPLEIHMTIDGVTFLFAVANPVSGTFYYPSLTMGSETGQPLIIVDPQNTRAFMLEAKSIEIKVETTGGTVSNISARVRYGVLKP